MTRQATRKKKGILERARAVAQAAADDLFEDPAADKVAWGDSRRKRLGVPGGKQINVHRATAFIFQWHGTSFKSALTSIAALLHFGVYAGLWRLAVWMDSRGVEVARYAIDDEVVNAISLLYAFVITSYISFVVSRYCERLQTCVDTANSCSAAFSCWQNTQSSLSCLMAH